MAERSWRTTGCGLLLGLPFLVGGLFAAVQTVRTWLGPREDWVLLILLPTFAVVFVGVGLGLPALALRRSAAANERDALEAAHPGAPWLWRPEWRDGRVRCESRSGALGLASFGLLWLLISLPGTAAALLQELPAGNRAAWLALLFPIVGLWILFGAATAFLRWRKYGTSVFEPEPFPGVVGGSVAGAVRVGTRLETSGDLVATLSCVESRRGDEDEGRHASETVLWQDEARIPSSALRRSRHATLIPVEFRLPFEARPTDDADTAAPVEWRLHLAAPSPGADFRALFRVPVFRTADSSPANPGDSSLRSFEAQAPRDPRIVVRRVGSGRLDLWFPAFRHPSLSFGLGAFVLVWWGFTGALVRPDTHVVFPIVFGAFGALLALIWFDATFGGSRVVVGGGTLTVRRTWLGVFGWTSRVPASEVERIVIENRMQAGGAQKVVHHALAAELGGKRRLTLATLLRSRRECRWLRDRLEEALRGR